VHVVGKSVFLSPQILMLSKAALLTLAELLLDLFCFCFADSSGRWRGCPRWLTCSRPASSRWSVIQSVPGSFRLSPLDALNVAASTVARVACALLPVLAITSRFWLCLFRFCPISWLNPVASCGHVAFVLFPCRQALMHTLEDSYNDYIRWPEQVTVLLPPCQLCSLSS
jgi:hypothetical protein